MIEELVRHKWHANAAYLAEANQHAAARQDEELRTPLHHILVANRFWLFLTVGIEFDREMEARVPPSLDALIARYRETETIEMEWLARCDEAELARELTTPRLPGKAFTVAQAFMQIVLHSHGHRAQAALRLRSLGGTPPRSDFDHGPARTGVAGNTQLNRSMNLNGSKEHPSSMLESDISIRPAVDADRPRLIPLINSAFSVETFLQGPRTDEERLATSMEKGTILVAESPDGRLLASVYTELRGNHGYLGMLAVDPAQQGGGLGRKLMRAAEEHFRARGCDALEISVLSLRPELLPIYRRFGFVETRTEPFQYPHPLAPGLECHCIVMKKAL